MMRRALLAAAFFAAGPGMATGDGGMRLATRERIAVQEPGAVAAFAVDTTIVDVSVDAGRVLLAGRRAGDTVVTVILAAGVRSFRVHVDPGVPLVTTQASVEKRSGVGAEARYDSALKRLTTVTTGRFQSGDTTLGVHVEAVRQGADVAGVPRAALPSASITLTTPQRSVVLLDSFVQDSPLTLDGVVLRGVHWAEDGFALHAGVTAWSPLETLLVPQGERAVTVAKTLPMGALRVTPQFAWLPDSRASTHAVASVAVEVGSAAEPLHARLDAGLGGTPAAALDVDYRNEVRQVSVRAQARPEGFAALAAARPPGTHLDTAWTERLRESTTLSAAAAASRVAWGTTDTRTASARVELREQLDAHWSATVAAGAGRFDSDMDVPTRRTTVSAGLAWEGPQWGASAQLRHQALSGAVGGGGPGARVAVHARSDGWRVSGFADVQSQAPTLDLVLRERNDVARALTGLGLAGGSPEEIVAALRDNAGALSGAGFALGPVRLQPRRTQLGMDLSWRGKGARAPELGVRMLRDHVQGVVGVRSSTLASAHATWRFGESTDVDLAVTRWTLQREGLPDLGESGVQLSVRSWFDTSRSMTAFSQPISGRVLRDDDAAGGPVPMADVEVLLDRSRRTRTDAQGRYVFERPGAGTHTVEAMLPAADGAYFTTPSALTRDAGGTADFGIALTGVRLGGVVLSDAGLPLPGVKVSVQGARSMTAVTDSSGAWRLAMAPGEVTVSIAPESVPPGHDLRALAARKRHVEPGLPVAVNFMVRAMRGLEGVVEGVNGAPVTVSVPELSRATTTDAQGRFMLRGLPAGALTLVFGRDGKSAQQTVRLPETPGTVRGVRLTLG